MLPFSNVHEIVCLRFTLLSSSPSIYCISFYFNKLLLYKAAHLECVPHLVNNLTIFNFLGDMESHSAFLLGSGPIKGRAIL